MSSWSSIASVDNYTNNIITESPRSAMDYIKSKMSIGKKAVEDFTAYRVTALRGYFEEVSSKKVKAEIVCLKKSNGGEACITGDQVASTIGSYSASELLNIPAGSVEVLSATSTAPLYMKSLDQTLSNNNLALSLMSTTTLNDVNNAKIEFSANGTTTIQKYGNYVLQNIKLALEKLSDIFIDTKLYVREIRADKVETKLLCIEDVCVNKTQLQNLLQGNAQNTNTGTNTNNTGTGTGNDTNTGSSTSTGTTTNNGTGNTTGSGNASSTDDGSVISTGTTITTTNPAPETNTGDPIPSTEPIINVPTP